MMNQCNQNFMKYVKNEFKTKLIQFGALSTISFEELIEKAVQLENATAPGRALRFFIIRAIHFLV